MHPAMRTIFAADIGATNCRFALFEANPCEPGRPMLRLLREKWLAGADYPDFRQALERLLAPSANGANDPFLTREAHALPAIAVLAPAGPVEGEVCRISNLPWVIQGQDVRDVLGIVDVRLINDFAAQAYACLMPDAIDAFPLLPGEAYQEPMVPDGSGLSPASACAWGFRR